MTSGVQLMSDDTHIPDSINRAAGKLLLKRTERLDMIVHGLLPRTSELLDGLPFMKRSIDIDIVNWTKGKLLISKPEEKLAIALHNLGINPSIDALKFVLDADEGIGDLGADFDRIIVYLACMGDGDAIVDLKTMMLASAARSDVHSFSNFVRRCVAEGLKPGQKSMDDAYLLGFKRLNDLTDVADKFFTANVWSVAFAAGDDAPPPPKSKRSMPPSTPTPAEDDAEFLAAVAEDRAEFVGGKAGGLVVVPAFPAGATGHRKDLQRGWEGIAGSRLPAVGRGDLAAHRASLIGRWPHAEEIIDVVLGDLTTSEAVRFRPTLLVGPPGSGKTSLVRRIAETLGLPSTVVNLGGASDSSLAGTSAQWHSAREAIPLQVIKSSKVSNPLLIWDEVEKASPDRRNGSALDAMLPLLERSQAAQFRDLALEVDCDLSMVSHFATANDLDTVPAPLRDRMRILTMPEPGWQHLGDLVDGIVWDLMTDRGLDIRWVSPLAEDELDLVRKNWPGGSIRQLQRIVQTIVDGRETIWGRA